MGMNIYTKKMTNGEIWRMLSKTKPHIEKEEEKELKKRSLLDKATRIDLTPKPDTTRDLPKNKADGTSPKEGYVSSSPSSVRLLEDFFNWLRTDERARFLQPEYVVETYLKDKPVTPSSDKDRLK